MTESKAQKIIESKLETLEPGSPRYEVLDIARRFKTSWVDLGSKLHEVRSKKMFTSWGFATFDQYCEQEIRIKPQTAVKLTTSYAFLKKEEPGVLKHDGIKRTVPDVQVVDLLRRLKEKEQVPEKAYARIRDMALEDSPVSELRKEIKPHMPASPPPAPDLLIRKFVAQANRLAEGLAAATGIPHIIIERALALVDDLRALVKH